MYTVQSVRFVASVERKADFGADRAPTPSRTIEHVLNATNELCKRYETIFYKVYSFFGILGESHRLEQQPRWLLEREGILIRWLS